MVLATFWFWIHSMLWPNHGIAPPIFPNATEFMVIGAGLQRTGTFSTRIALSKLLDGKCYHGFVGSMGWDSDFWLRATYNNLTDNDWHAVLPGQGYKAGVGEPISLFYEDLMRIFPEAKVILTQRASEKWYKSMTKAIIEPRNFLEEPPISWFFGFLGIVHAKQVMANLREEIRIKRKLNYTSWTAVEAGPDVAMDFFNEWNRQVIQKVPKERLLIYDVKEGWEPLCRFLNLPIPDEPFPRLNDYGTIEATVKGSYYGIVLGLPLSVILLLVWKSRCGKDLLHLVPKFLGRFIYGVAFCLGSKCLKTMKSASKAQKPPILKL
ncbi:hypothetical protein TCAL_14902 [Tigriopus californicus]|uniref:Sulfotransferase domain-containing protein n=1 Tax=Tigriopus californicus TaxID=6832 RepID=A0A553P405_TIGCA|nr:uncharacterized protein LOC131883875 [Tigriopus californicus]TRY72425.1 hypothetical protein TCAL_14902 [Tigriopus californicus]